jgi:hypothetical protein
MEEYLLKDGPIWSEQRKLQGLVLAKVHNAHASRQRLVDALTCLQQDLQYLISKQQKYLYFQGFE